MSVEAAKILRPGMGDAEDHRLLQLVAAVPALLAGEWRDHADAR
jgi:hypothetical protein